MSWKPVVARFDEFIHVPDRLRIAAALATGTELEFSALQESTSLTTSHLSKQLRLLADAGYIVLDKRPQTVGRPRTWVRFTPEGRRAWLGHVKALDQLAHPDS
ncbi:MAG: transcriptional regulator [Acidipropionibacterium sp.]|jgi:DNA-binding MarR family transcriptional regulator|nr:transcriptional regulator [Acidipropionibacterium sp.]